MGWVMARIYDPFMRGSEEACLTVWRSELLADVRGRVLEIGAGTGSSLPHYRNTVEHLVLAEPDRHMRSVLEQRIPNDLQKLADVIDADVEHLPFGPETFDVVVSSLVLCSVPDLDSALAHIYRILVPGGRLVFLEHVADEERPDRLRWQQRLEPLWKRVAGGCHLTRRTHAAIEAAGFTVRSLERASIRKSNPLTRRSIRGVAVKPASPAGDAAS